MMVSILILSVGKYEKTRKFVLNLQFTKQIQIAIVQQSLSRIVIRCLRHNTRRTNKIFRSRTEVTPFAAGPHYLYLCYWHFFNVSRTLCLSPYPLKPNVTLRIPPTHITQHHSNAKGYIELYELHGFYCQITISDLTPRLQSQG